jgi:hypothetical protein
MDGRGRGCKAPGDLEARQVPYVPLAVSTPEKLILAFVATAWVRVCASPQARAGARV